jgi:PAS domain-containing protein
MPSNRLENSFEGELQAELQLILNAVVEGVCGVDAEGNATFGKDALLKMTGYQAEEFPGGKMSTNCCITAGSMEPGIRPRSVLSGRELTPIKRGMSPGNFFGGRMELASQRTTGCVRWSDHPAGLAM